MRILALQLELKIRIVGKPLFPAKGCPADRLRQCAADSEGQKHRDDHECRDGFRYKDHHATPRPGLPNDCQLTRPGRILFPFYLLSLAHAPPLASNELLGRHNHVAVLALVCSLRISFHFLKVPMTATIT